MKYIYFLANNIWNVSISQTLYKEDRANIFHNKDFLSNFDAELSLE